jgi:hypothetical protein
MVEKQADDYRQGLLRLLDKDARRAEVMALFERNLEVEADDGKAAAYLALSGAGLSHCTSVIDKIG